MKPSHVCNAQILSHIVRDKQWAAAVNSRAARYSARYIHRHAKVKPETDALPYFYHFIYIADMLLMLAEHVPIPISSIRARGAIRESRTCGETNPSAIGAMQHGRQQAPLNSATGAPVATHGADMHAVGTHTDGIVIAPQPKIGMLHPIAGAQQLIVGIVHGIKHGTGNIHNELPTTHGSPPTAHGRAQIELNPAPEHRVGRRVPHGTQAVQKAQGKQIEAERQDIDAAPH